MVFRSLFLRSWSFGGIAVSVLRTPELPVPEGPLEADPDLPIHAVQQIRLANAALVKKKVFNVFFKLAHYILNLKKA